MRPEYLPYPVAQGERTPVLTEAEKNAVLSAMAAGWKAYVQQQHLIQRALVAVRPVAQKWAEMTLAEKRVILKDAEIKDAWLAEGWPIHGVAGKMARYDGQLKRLGHVVATAGFSEERKEEIRRHLYVLVDLDNQFMAEARDTRAKIDALMMGANPPATGAELVSRLSSPVDKPFFVAQYALERVGKTDFKAFADSYKVKTETTVEG